MGYCAFLFKNINQVDYSLSAWNTQGQGSAHSSLGPIDRYGGLTS